MPQFSADLELVVGLDMLFQVLANADGTLEAEQFKSDDAMTLLRPVTDRLAINPRRRTIEDMGMDPTRRMTEKKKRGGAALCSLPKTLQQLVHWTCHPSAAERVLTKAASALKPDDITQ